MLETERARHMSPKSCNDLLLRDARRGLPCFHPPGMRPTFRKLPTGNASYATRLSENQSHATSLVV